jgi:dinuclear metal center YbgI/SA1388 family protein
MELDTLLASLRELAPEETAMDGDPVGLLIEPPGTDIGTVIVCLDCTAHVAHLAAETKADLVISHHPLIYNPLRRLRSDDPVSAVAMDLVRAGAGLYAMHTNWDAATQGINDTLAAQLGLRHIQRLGKTPLANLARIGDLPQALPLRDLLDHIASHLTCRGTSALRYAQPQSFPATVQRIAVCGGAGASLAGDALSAGAEALITADVRHHEFIDAASRGLLLIDAGHEATEAPGMQNLACLLSARFPELSVTFSANWAA